MIPENPHFYVIMETHNFEFTGKIKYEKILGCKTKLYFETEFQIFDVKFSWLTFFKTFSILKSVSDMPAGTYIEWIRERDLRIRPTIEVVECANVRKMETA